LGIQAMVMAFDTKSQVILLAAAKKKIADLGRFVRPWLGRSELLHLMYM
jgi:hypothetical protein